MSFFDVTLMDSSALTFEVAFSPEVVDLDAAIRLHLDPLRLRDLDVLLRRRASTPQVS